MTASTLHDSNLRKKAFQALNQLPAFSPTLSRLLASLAKENVFYGEIASIIEKDTVLAGHVLKLVNSALYARSGTINSVRHAVSILGLNKLRNFALSLSVSRMWKSVKTPKTWSHAAFNLHSVATGVMSDLLAQNVRVRYAEGAFTAGLLHGVGKLMIATGLPEHFDEILATYRNGTYASIQDAEMHIVGFYHSELGAAALSEWKLPVDIQAAVAAQDSPGPDRDGAIELSRLLQQAHLLINGMDVMIPACACATPRTPQDIFEELGLQGKAEKILQEYKNEFDSMRSFF